MLQLFKALDDLVTPLLRVSRESPGLERAMIWVGHKAYEQALRAVMYCLGLQSCCPSFLPKKLGLELSPAKHRNLRLLRNMG